jgi:hypothetical protein
MIHPLTFLKGAGLGAGMMYFFDPVAGNRRRAQVRDQLIHATTACNQQAGVTYRDASNRLQGATSEISKMMESSDQPIMERVQEGVSGVGRTLGMHGNTWSPTAKAVAMVGGAGLVASLMSKRDLAAVAFGIIGLSFVAKELVDQEEVRAQGQQRQGESPRGANQGQKSSQQSGQQTESAQGGTSKSKQGGDQGHKTSEKTGLEASIPTEKKPAYDL